MGEDLVEDAPGCHRATFILMVVADVVCASSVFLLPPAEQNLCQVSTLRAVTHQGEVAS